jgi:hypothetical protein
MVHNPHHVFSMVTGEDTPDENYNFRLAFALVDTSLRPIIKPPDFDRIGSWSVKIFRRVYDPVTSSLSVETKSVTHHPCTLDDAINLGEQFD